MIGVRIVTAGVVLCGLLAGCGGAPGHIVGALPDTRFVDSPERRYAYSEADRGWVVVGLDGRIHRRLFGGEYGIKDISADGRVFVLSNSDTDLFVATEGGGEIREVPEFRGLTGALGLSPDGRLVAAGKHPDFDLPQSQWVDDERLYLIDVDTLRVREAGRFEVTDGRPPFDIVWLDGDSVRLNFFGGTYQKIDLRDGAREVFPVDRDPLHASRRWKTAPGPPDCGMEIRLLGAWEGDEGFEVVQPGKEPRRVVVVEGRERGFHDIAATISEAAFTRDCSYVTFHFEDGRQWVAEVATGKVGPVLPGRTTIFERWYPIGLP